VTKKDSQKTQWVFKKAGEGYDREIKKNAAKDDLSPGAVGEKRPGEVKLSSADRGNKTLEVSQPPLHLMWRKKSHCPKNVGHGAGGWSKRHYKRGPRFERSEEHSRHVYHKRKKRSWGTVKVGKAFEENENNLLGLGAEKSDVQSGGPRNEGARKVSSMRQESPEAPLKKRFNKKTAILSEKNNGVGVGEIYRGQSTKSTEKRNREWDGPSL